MATISIGEFSYVSRLSPKALRLYDELGLLVPVHVDAGTGYRWYEATQPFQPRPAYPQEPFQDLWVGVPVCELRGLQRDPHHLAGLRFPLLPAASLSVAAGVGDGCVVLFAHGRDALGKLGRRLALPRLSPCCGPEAGQRCRGSRAGLVG